MVAEISGDHMIKVPKRADKDMFGSHGSSFQDCRSHCKCELTFQNVHL